MLEKDLQKVYVNDLGQIDYQAAWDYQGQLQKGLIEAKLQRRRSDAVPADAVDQIHHFLFCEHAPVYTLGKSGSENNLLLSGLGLEEKGISFYKINRGGDITYHGPGQVVGYPIFDLDYFFTDVHKYVRYIEEAIIRMLAEYGIEGQREPGYTGVWLAADETLPKRKICAIGVHLSRWVTMHGFALNVNTDLKYFNFIIPCGINDKEKTVTSMELELGGAVDMATVKTKIIKHFAQLFGFEIVKKTDQL